MSVRTDVINLSINVQGNAAQNQLNDLRKKAADLRFEMQGLTKGSAEYAAKAKELQNVTSEIDKLKKSIGLTSLTQKELTQELTRLKALKGSMVPFTEEFKAMERQIRAVEDRLYEVKNGVQGFSAFFSKISDEVKQFGLVAAGYLGFQFITDQFRNIINGSGRLSDSLADIQRVTGLTDKEVQQLNKSLGEVNTRTSTEGLRNIALIAGKLGVAKDDILEFTKAVDMLVVALGDELGDADQITTQLGKILNVFEGQITGDNITRLGNAIVDLANKGVASGPFLVDFAQRVAGIAKTANISLPAVLGLAAGLEESGLKVESSSTAIQKLISDIANDLPKAAKIAGVDVEKFNEMFAKNPQEALLQYAAGLQKNKSSFAEVSATFKDAGEEGARTVAVLATLGQKTDFFRGKMIDATGAYKEYGEITEANNIKNETFGATLDKLGKEFNSFVNSSTINKFLEDSVKGLLNFIKFLKELPQWLNENRTTLIALTTVIIAYIAAKTKATQAAILNRVATLLEIAADKIEMAQLIATNAVRQISIGLQSAYIVVTNLLTGRITLATAAQRLWNITTSAFGGITSVVILAVGGLITLLSFLTDKTKELTAAQKLNSEVQRKASESTTEEISKINLLKAAITDQNSSYDNKKKALQTLIALNPDYLSGLTLENIKTKEGKDLLDKYIGSLTQKAELEAKQSLLTDKLKQRNQVYSDFREIGAFKNKSDNELDNIINNNEQLLSRGSREVSGGLEQLIKKKFSGYDFDEAKNVVAQVKLLEDDLTKAAVKNVETVIKGGTDTGKAAANTVKAAIDDTKKQIKGLEDDYLQIDVRNKKGLQDNLNQRKQLQEKLDALEGKQSPGQKQAEKQIDGFKVFMKGIEDAIAENSIPDRSKKILDILQKTRDELEKLDDFKKKGAVSTADFIDAQAKIYQQQRTAISKFLEDESKRAVKPVNESTVSAGLLPDTITRVLDKMPTVSIDLPVMINPQMTEEEKKKSFDKLKKIIDGVEKDTDASYRVDILNANGFRAQREAQLANLQYLHDKELENKSLTDNEKLELEAKYQQDRLNVVLESYQKELEFAQSALNMLDAFNKAKSAKENSTLNKELRENDLKRASFKKELDSKLLSQAQYNAKIAELDKDSDAKKEAVAKKQFERNKKMQMAQAAINGAQAALKTIADFGPPVPPNFLGIAAMAFTVGTTIAELLAISRTEYSPSSSTASYGKGGLLENGPYHDDEEKGLHVVDPRTGKTEMLLEKDEAVLTGNAMRSNEQITASGTPSQIASAINSRFGGVSWDTGAKIGAPKWTTAPPAAINPNMPKIMATGGLTYPSSQKQKDASQDDEMSDLMRELIDETKQNREELKNMKTKLHAVVSIKEYREEEKKYDAAKKASGMA